MANEQKPEAFNFDQHMAKVKKTMYQVELVVLGRTIKAPLGAVNLESLSAMCNIFVAANYPQVHGYTIWDAEGTELLIVVDAMGFSAHFGPTVQKVMGAQVLRSGIPVIQGGRDGIDLQKLMEEGRKAGRLVDTNKAVEGEKKPEAPPAAPPPPPAAPPKTDENPAA